MNKNLKKKKEDFHRIKWNNFCLHIDRYKEEKSKNNHVHHSYI